MKEPTIQLGRVAGLRVGANWTALVIFAILTGVLGAVALPDRYPDIGAAARWTLAVLAALLLLASLLAHEVGHAVLARREGIQVVWLTVWLLGSAARLRGAYASAGAELRTAAGGPVVSALLAVGFVALAALVPFPESLDGVLLGLGLLNAIMLAFNLLPLRALDGGHMLHAALWARSGDLDRATARSAAIGRVTGYVVLGGSIAAVALLIAFG